MIWFDIHSLEEKLSEEKISDKEGLKYVIVTLIMNSLTGLFILLDYTYPTWVTLSSVAASIIILVIGVRATFNTNLLGDGKDFFKRFFALAFVMSIRIFIFMILIVIPLAFIIAFVDTALRENSIQPVTDIVFKNSIYLIGGIIYNIIFWVMLNKSFNRVSKGVSVIS